MTSRPVCPQTRARVEVLSGPEVVRSELRWRVRTADGRQAVLAELRQELADTEALRRRYLYETERLASVTSPHLAATLECGPEHDARDVSSPAPWRLRVQPEGACLADVLESRAPLPVDEALELVERLAGALVQIHEAGLVLRDLEPKSIVLAPDGTLVITDVGFARMDILSSRTASSLMLESSAYAAPEHLRATVVDVRADVFSLAAIAWHALTGLVPFGADSPFVRNYDALPQFEALCPGAPEGIGTLLSQCLREEPDLRPSSADEVLRRLRGQPGQELSIERVRCQACGEELRLGLRLCLSCGKLAVQFTEASSDEPSFRLVLKKAEDKPEFQRILRRFYEDIGEGPPPELNFLVGDARMYSRHEQKTLTHVPVALLRGLSEESANELYQRLRRDDISVKVAREKDTDAQLRWANRTMLVAGVGGGAAFFAGLATTTLAAAVLGPIVCIGGLIGGGIARYVVKRNAKPGLGSLRKGPLALPASDSLVAKLADLLQKPLAADVREQVSELALGVQRLATHRAEADDVTGELAMLLEPLEKLVVLAVQEAEAIRAIDGELAELDEGVLIRAISASEMRGEPATRREHLLVGLDRVRTLEDRRTERMGALLHAAGLVRRTANLGLVRPERELLERNRITAALAELGS